jgi:uncharacterized protein (DUF433 family)
MPPSRFLDSTGWDEPPPAIWRDPDRHSGDGCFGGTRVPVYVLFHFLADGADIAAFLEAYPTVRRGQVLAVLEHAAFHVVQEDEFARDTPPRADKAKLRSWEDGWEERLAWWRTWSPPEPRPKRLVRWADEDGTRVLTIRAAGARLKGTTVQEDIRGSRAFQEVARCPTCHELPERRAGHADG